MSATPFKVKAVYEYKSVHDDDLSFTLGQIITVTEEEDNEWYVGEYVDSSGAKHEGLFPRNFVERYEPEAPPRPSRSRTKKEAAAAAELETDPAVTPHKTADDPMRVSEPVLAQPLPQREEPLAAEPSHPVSEPRAAPPFKAPSNAKGPPPPVAEKSSSFKDRIAAFNKTSSAPLAPIKPSAPAGGGFVKKPFVPPPPARDAYVPPPREVAPAKVYRREEDPEIAARQAQDLDDAERAGLVPAGDEGGEDAPRATTLKERIAALQKQQQEQALRRSELAAKEKVKRPTRKRTESGDNIADATELEPQPLSRVNTAGSAHRVSMEGSRENARASLGRRQSRDYKTPEARPISTFSDGNDADQSGAGETTEEAERGSIEVDDTSHRSRGLAGMSSPGRISRHNTGGVEADIEEGEEGDEEGDGDEVDEMDAETRRRLELRERMARMSGGMGMAGMFGPPIGMGMHGTPTRIKRASGASDQRPLVEEAQAPPSQRVPIVPLPGIHGSESPESIEHEPTVLKEPELRSIPATNRSEQTPEMEDIEPVATTAPASLTRQRTLPTSPAVSGMRSSFGSPRSREERRRSLMQSRKAIQSTDWCGYSSYSAYNGAPVMPLTAGIRRRPVPQAPSTHQLPAPPVPSETRAVPPPPPNAIRSPSPGSESDDEMSVRRNVLQPQSPPIPQRAFRTGPASPIPSGVTARPEGPRSPPLSNSARLSYIQEPSTPTSSAQSMGDKRASRPPPIPSGLPTMSPGSEMRAPPPPPPTAIPPTRQLSATELPRVPVEQVGNDEESDYEGDYDTDIASGASHRDALTGHARELSSDEGRLSEETPTRGTVMPLAGAPLVPSSATRAMPPIPPPSQRAAPPPPPHQQALRQSMEAPRGMPPVPPSRDALSSPPEEDEEYDPYNYSVPSPAHGLMPSTKAWIPDRPIQESDPSLYGVAPQRPLENAPPPPPQDRAAPPPPPGYQQPPVPQGGAVRQSRDLPRQSSDYQSAAMSSPSARRSVEQSRPSGDQGYIAQDVDLSESTQWWTQPNTPPPVFQNRSDVLYEFEESTTSKRGGRTAVSKDIYILFPDYSQTTISARFDSKEAADVALEQRRRQPPPPMPRKDVLEAAHKQFGNAIANAANQRAGHAVLDGSPHALVLDILRKQPNALLPVGTRTYGVCIYANLGNATVQQFDEIRPGDIITFRNAKFSGKHGAMHAKYSEDVGKPDHVAVVAEWDGSKRKIRVWEQGREAKKGVRAESFRVGDLKSGEVKVWRVMGRRWVGWESQG